jgi:hypothetical protein
LLEEITKKMDRGDYTSIHIISHGGQGIISQPRLTEMTFLIAETIAIIAFLALFSSFFLLLKYNSDIGLGNCGDRSHYRYS